MATETLPANSAISFENWVTGRTSNDFLTTADYASGYSYENIIDPKRTKKWRTTTATAHELKIDLGQDRIPTVVALIDSNLSTTVTSSFTNAEITLSGASSSDFADSAGTLHTYSLSVYLPVSTGGNLMIWYPTAPDSYTTSAKRYWSLKFPDTSWFMSYHELGGLWLGEYTNIAIDSNVGANVFDTSNRITTDYGLQYVDKLNTRKNIGISLSKLSRAAAYGIAESAEASHARNCLLDIHAYAAVRADGIKQNSAYYGHLDTKGGISLNVMNPINNTIDLEFEEDRR